MCLITSQSFLFLSLFLLSLFVSVFSSSGCENFNSKHGVYYLSNLTVGSNSSYWEYQTETNNYYFNLCNDIDVQGAPQGFSALYTQQSNNNTVFYPIATLNRYLILESKLGELLFYYRTNISEGCSPSMTRSTFIILSCSTSAGLGTVTGVTFNDFLCQHSIEMSSVMACPNQEFCKVGEYSPTGSIPCNTCPSGSTSTTYNSTSCTCEKGNYWLNNTNCIQCPSGSYSVNDDQDFCDVCPAGTYSNSGTSTCIDCENGFYSNENSSVCLPCSPGSYSISGSRSCTLCPPGSYSQQNGSFACASCSFGTYAATSGSISCQKCPLGTVSSADDDYCMPCSPGYFSYNPEDGCTPCQAGSYSSTNGSLHCDICPSGSISSLEGQDKCNKCSAGTFSTGNQTLCVECPSDTYSNEGSDECFSCSKYKHSSPGSKHCSLDTSMWFIIMGGVATVLIAIVVIIFVIKKRKTEYESVPKYLNL